MTYCSSTLNRVALLLIILLAGVGQLRVVGQTSPPLGFTLERRVTDKDKAGREFLERTELLYVSSSGNWRYEATYSNGQKVETICVVDKGVFFTDYNRKRFVKIGNGCRPSATTSERLEADSIFVRTESVLDRLAYLHRRDIRYIEETYFVPELGPFPFKRISYLDGYTLYEEPVRLLFGEPEPSQLMPLDYSVIEDMPSEPPNEARAEAEWAIAAIASLPEAYRETLMLRLVAGLDGPEIAARTGLTHGSVRVNLHRGIALLRERLGGSRDA